MTTFKSTDHKFTVYDESRSVDCYLIVGFLDEQNRKLFQHLNIGDICYLDLRVSNKTSGSKMIEIMISMISEFIADGAKVETAIRVLKYQKFSPGTVEHDGTADIRGSICDYIGRYLEGLQ